MINILTARSSEVWTSLFVFVCFPSNHLRRKRVVFVECVGIRGTSLVEMVFVQTHNTALLYNICLIIICNPGMIGGTSTIKSYTDTCMNQFNFLKSDT
jgi:hypothetical protein